MKKWIGLLMLGVSCTAPAADLMAFWDDSPRHGANIFNQQPPSVADFRAAKAQGIEWVRIAYDKWQPAQRDFLIGSAEHYQGLVTSDLQVLKTVLDNADKAGVKVVISPLTLPGLRWVQNNQNRVDARLWQDKKYWRQAAQFWRDLAVELRDYPAVVAYNLINEPAPELNAGVDEQASPAKLKAWYKTVENTPRDLPAFYREVIAAVRAVDAKTPIMLDGGWYAGARGTSYWPAAMQDQRVLYAYHMYEPYVWSNPKNSQRKTPLVYPGVIAGADWNKAMIAQWVAPFYQWAAQQNVAKSRLVAAEFGCHRMAPGCARYLDDVLSVFDEKQSHWAFYSWREDAYDGYDYELGDKKLPWAYWQAQEKGESYRLKREITPLYRPIYQRLNK